MKKAIIIALLIAQANSMSFYDVFAPVEDSLGRLVSDVVTDIKDTIDCTILAVEHVFSLGGIFGRNTDYDDKCKGRSSNDDVQTEDDSPTDDTYSSDDTYSTDDDTQEKPEEDKPPNTTIKKAITDEIQESVSEASQRIHSILDHSDAHLKIENVKISIKNETDRLVQISALLRQEFERLPDEVRQKFNFKFDEPSIQDLFDEVKLLYQVEQRDKSSAEANEVRRMFDKVLDVLHVNDIDGPLSDEDEVKLILKNLGKSSNESLIDIEKQVSLWTEEEEQEISDIKNVVITNNNRTQSGSKNNSSENILLVKKINEIETQQARMIDFSNSLKNITKNILEKVNEMDLPHDGNIQNNRTNSMPSSDLNEYKPTSHAPTKELLNDTLSVSSEPPVILESSTEITSSTEARIDFTESSVSSISAHNIDQTTVVTPKLSTSTETVSIISGSWPSTPTSNPNQQPTSTPQSSHDVSKSSSQGVEATDTTNVSQTLKTSMSTVQLVQTNHQENIPATQIPPTIVKDLTGLDQPQIFNTQTNTTAKQLSSESSVLPQISATSVSTLQSNIQTVNTATQAPVSNAQASPLMQSSLLVGDNASADINPSRLNADKLASVSHYLQLQNDASTTPSSQPPMQTSNLQNNGPKMSSPSTGNIKASPAKGRLSPLNTQTNPSPPPEVKTYPLQSLSKRSSLGAPTYPSSGLSQSKVSIPAAPGSQSYPPLTSPPAPRLNTKPSFKLSSPPNAQTYPSIASPYVLGQQQMNSSSNLSSPPNAQSYPPNAQTNPSTDRPSGSQTYPTSGHLSLSNPQTYPSMGRPVPGAQPYPPSGRSSPPNPQAYPSIGRPVPGAQPYPPLGRSSPENHQAYPSMSRPAPGAQPYPPSRRFSPQNQQAYPSMGRPALGAQPYPTSVRSSPPNPQAYPSMGRPALGAQPYPPSGRSSPPNPQAYPSMGRPALGAQPYPPLGRSSPENQQAYPSMGRPALGAQPYPPSGRSSPPNPQAYPSIGRPIPGAQSYPPLGRSSPPNQQAYPSMGRSVPGAQTYPSAANPKSYPPPARVPPYQSNAQPHQFDRSPSSKYASGAYPSQSNPLANRTPLSQTWGR